MSKITYLETVKIKTGIDTNFLADTLTTDIELIDGIFDLIDNSVDAAKNSIYKDKLVGLSDLPDDYSGFRIKIRFGSDSIIVEDNCIGIDSNILEKAAFYTGKRSNHKYGIGYYGLGLKRALLKSGSTYSLITDNNECIYRASFNKNTFSSDGEHELFAERFISKGKSKTLLMVTDLHLNVKEQISDSDWIKNIINELSVRYSILLRKGLKIVLTNSHPKQTDTYLITPSVPEIRDDGIIKDISDEYLGSGLVTNFHVGVHKEYKFPGEWEHDKNSNEMLTKSFGIYYICNDRVIVASSTELKHGFVTKWHPEYNGFICLVHLKGENPKDLPWNTAKTEMKINSQVFLSIRMKVELLAKKYRSEAKRLIEVWKSTNNLDDDARRKVFAEKTGARKLTAEEISAISRKNPRKNKDKNNKELVSGKFPSSDIGGEIKLKTDLNSKNAVGKNSHVHTKNWETLLPKNQFPISDDMILNNLIVEASNIKISDAHHATCLLYRALFEAAFRAYVKRNKLFEKIKEHYYSKGEGARKNHSDLYKKNQGLDLAICSHWLVDNDSVYPVESKRKLILCAKNLRANIKIMNGVVHGNQILGGDGVVQRIRNETIELLEFLAIQ